jgi:bifunctional UDP-N-acetylglucosamine pyrophosphorylase / glucosamine-1-phosphate N-acetyltransferase
MQSTPSHKLGMLQTRGVAIPTPHSVEVDMHVDPDRIADGVVLHVGTKIFGPQTMIAQNSVVGREGPVTIENCYVGPGVQLKAGYFKDAVFLEGASLGYGAHVREGTILEEQASTAHCVGLKQTILMPYVTLGSLINFCDCLMAGGTSRKDHSEVGSSFIHFNFTPNQDKATPSILGDVPNGVMMNQRPIFMGGQGGLVGPCRIAYGTVSAAGTIVRKDQLKPDHLIIGGAGKGGCIPWKAGVISVSKRIIKNNLIYIGNLFALRAWYRHVRRIFISSRFPEILWQGLVKTLDRGLDERFRRLSAYVEGLGGSALAVQYQHFEQRCQEHGPELGDLKLRDQFLNRLITEKSPQGNYIETIKALPFETTRIGTQWLQGVVDKVVSDGDGMIIKSP